MSTAFKLELWDGYRLNERGVMGFANSAGWRLTAPAHVGGWHIEPSVPARSPLHDACVAIVNKTGTGEHQVDVFRDGVHVLSCLAGEGCASYSPAPLTSGLSEWLPYTRQAREPVRHVFTHAANGDVSFKGLLICNRAVWTEDDACDWLARYRAVQPYDYAALELPGDKGFAVVIGDYQPKVIPW
jgi:hypothetical protein